MAGGPDREAEALLEFWFGVLTDGFADDAHRRRWFSGGRAFDDECRVRFGDLAMRAAEGGLAHWLTTPRGTLAWILLCDQIPRNIYRGQALAFATDGPALTASRNGVEAGFDQTLTADERCFFYLPFEHSESLVDQHTCVGLFTDLVEQTPERFRRLTEGYLPYAKQHRDIIRRFGRFPHRNTVLGRTSTAEELDYLAGGNTFGQSPPEP
ncbi:MAG: DUF924 family protein [Pseudomonadales bacterium]